MADHDRSPRRAAAIPVHGALVAAAACLIGALAFAFYAQSVIHRWYAAPFLIDFGWFNYLIGGRSFSLHDPNGIDAQSYYSIHVAPLLVLFAGLSRLLGLTGVQPMVLMLGLAFGGAASMAFVILERFLRPAGAISAFAIAAAGAAAYAVSGVMRSTADYPHMEILYVPLALLTLHLLFQGRRIAAWVALPFCLAVREDAGLHLACILAAYLVLTALDERAVPRRARDFAPFLLVCLLYPAAAIVWQRMNWPSAGTFGQIYLGAPPYAHLTGALLRSRAHLFLGSEIWLTLTLLCALCVLPFRRRWAALTGAVACLPWLLLNVTAFSTAAGGFFGYYGFPFLVTALASLIVFAAPEPAPEENPRAVIPF